MPLSKLALRQLQRFLLPDVPGGGGDAHGELFFDEFVKTAGSTLSNAFTEAEKHHLMQSDVAQASLAAPTLFFRLGRHGPGDVVRPKSKGELAFSALEVGVALHALIAVNRSSKELEVSSSPQCIDELETQEKSQVVLSSAVLSYTELKQMRYWDIKGLSHKLHSDALDKRLTDSLLLPIVLEELYSCGSAGVR